MARTESAILADISSTNAKINTLIAGIGVAGDYREGDKAVNRASVITALQARLVQLQAELDNYPTMERAQYDIEFSADGADGSEYVGDDLLQ